MLEGQTGMKFVYRPLRDPDRHVSAEVGKHMTLAVSQHGYLTPQNSERRMAPVFLRQIEISYYS